MSESREFRILSLDGGGSKGFYTLGILKEIEAMCKKPLCDTFDLVFGTSTGAIIAALLALGYKADDIHKLYKAHVPTVMRKYTRWGASKALAQLAKEVFGNHKVDEFKTGIGIVTTDWDLERPRIFKASVKQAHGRFATFVPFFGCDISSAITASCSAYPLFSRSILRTSEGSRLELIDGGYCANNPTLYAIADAVKALGKKHEELRVVSLGVGVYPEPEKYGFGWLIKKLLGFRLLQKTLTTNTKSMEQLRMVLFPDVETIRVDDTFSRPEMATDLMEYDLEKLDMLYRNGRESFARREADLKKFLLQE